MVSILLLWAMIAPANAPKSPAIFGLFKIQSYIPVPNLRNFFLAYSITKYVAIPESIGCLTMGLSCSFLFLKNSLIFSSRVPIDFCLACFRIKRLLFFKIYLALFILYF